LVAGKVENTHVVHENPFVPASNFQYMTHTERTSYAAYTQGVYAFNEHWALTLGGRWARDMLDGEENDWYYNEDVIVPLGFSQTAGGTSSLAAVNQAFGYLGNRFLIQTGYWSQAFPALVCGVRNSARTTTLHGGSTSTSRRPTTTSFTCRRRRVHGPAASTWCSSARTDSSRPRA
jgi:hypothetical protein